MRELPGLAAARIWAAVRFPYLASGIFGAQVTAVPGLDSVAIDERWQLSADPELVADWSPAQFGSVLVHHVSARQVTLTGGGGTNMGAGLGKSRPRTLCWVSKAISPRTMTAIAVLLTFASGASDVTSFTRLGNVFTSVMTGNITVFGLSLARGSASLALHTAVAFAGYVTGVAAGTLIGRSRTDRTSAKSAAEPDGERWPAHMTLTLAAELALLAGVLAGWEATGSRPAGWAQYAILAAAACAMGIQSAAVVHLGLGNVSTTYLTGTLTGLVSAVFRPEEKVGWRRPGVLAGLLAGASLAGVLVANAAWAVPYLPLLGVAAATVLGARSVNSR